MYQYFIQKFERISEEETQFEISNYVQVLNELAQRKNFILFLESIISNPKLLKQISSTAYLHQNGFEKYFLFVSKKGWKLRLHIWQPNSLSDSKDYDVHNHAWDYASNILNGKMKNEIYQIGNSENSELFYHHLYEIDNITSISELKYQGDVDLFLTDKTQILEKGEFYSQSASVLHKVAPLPNILTATTVIQQKPFKKKTDVYSKINNQFKKGVGLCNKKYSSKEVISNFNKLIANI